MLHSFSFGELLLIFGIVLILFGGSRLASVGKSLGEGIANFKKGLQTPNEEKSQPTSAESAQDASVEKTQVHASRQIPIQSQSETQVVDAEVKTTR